MTVRAIARLHRDNALPEDDSVNVWHFIEVEGSGPDDFTGPAIADALQSFYVAVDEWLSQLLSGVITLQMYDLNDPEPRVPFFEGTRAFTPGGSSAPSEVAICTSFQAPPVSGVAQARRRGRTFIGPLTTASWTATSQTADVRPVPALLTALAAATEALCTPVGIGSTWALGVYSPTSNTTARVTEGWIDNALDTMRSRGAVATARTNWSV